MYLKYVLLLAVMALVAIQLVYAMAFYLQAARRLRIAGGTQGACSGSGRPLERETVRYILHDYISSTSPAVSLPGQVLSLVVAALVLAALAFYPRRGDLTARPIDVPYIVLLVLLLVMSMVVSFWLVPSYFGGGLAKAVGFRGIAEYRGYHQAITDLAGWVSEHRGPTGIFYQVFRDRVLDRMQRYHDLGGRAEAEVLYEQASGLDLVGYLIFDPGHRDFADLSQAIQGGGLMVRAFLRPGQVASDNVREEWDRFQKQVTDERLNIATATITDPTLAARTYNVREFPRFTFQYKGGTPTVYLYKGAFSAEDLMAAVKRESTYQVSTRPVLAPDLVYPSRYSPASEVARRLAPSRNVLLLFFILFAYVFFHLLYQKVAARYILVVVLAIFITVVLWTYNTDFAKGIF